MQYGEYERRRRALEEQCHADLELVRSAYQAKIRALETLWLISSDVSILPAAPPPLLPAEASPASEAATHPVQEERPAPASIRGKACAEIYAALPSLPEVFDKKDIVRALGYEPSRPTLHRAFDHLLRDRRIALVQGGKANRPSIYRRLPVPPEITGA